MARSTRKLWHLSDQLETRKGSRPRRCFVKSPSCTECGGLFKYFGGSIHSLRGGDQGIQGRSVFRSSRGWVGRQVANGCHEEVETGKYFTDVQKGWTETIIQWKSLCSQAMCVDNTWNRTKRTGGRSLQVYENTITTFKLPLAAQGT